ncbi:MAG: hypothetical protein L0Y56_01165 [Nitrospira sp.]|nr:hypothetical protein [Nitrospira sp.]
MDVVADHEKVAFVVSLDEEGFVAPLKEVAAGFVATVVTQGVGGVEKLHAFGEGWAVGFDEQVVVVAHEYVAVDGPAGAFGGLAEGFDEEAAVYVVPENSLKAVAAVHDVVDSSGVFDSGSSGHVWTFIGKRPVGQQQNSA